MSSAEGIRVAFVSDEKVKGLYEQLSKREIKTAAVSRLLEDQAASRERVQGPFVQIVLPVPKGKPDVLKLYLLVWLHLRSPSFTGYRQPLRHHGEREHVELVKTWLRQLAELIEHKPPTHGADWAAYVRSGIAAFEPKSPRWAAKQAKANAARFGKFF